MPHPLRPHSWVAKLSGVIGHRITPRQSAPNSPQSARSVGFACLSAPTTLSPMQLLAGASVERPPGPKYTAELRFAEIAPTSPLPKAGTLARWRKQLPPGFELALRVPEPCWHPPEGPLRPGGSLDSGLAWLSDALDALEATILVVHTDAAVTTGARDRQRLRDYFDRLPRSPDRTIVWRPRGLWEPDLVKPMATALSVTAGFDALDDPVPRDELVYGSLLAEGLRRTFSHAQLLDVLDKLDHSGAARAFIAVDSPQSFREARLLQALSEGRE